MGKRRTGHPGRESRLVVHVTLLVCLLTTSLAGAACGSDGIKVRSWEEAVGYAQTELDVAGDLEARLEGYVRIATNLSDEIELLDQVRPALQLINNLHEVRVPLIGDGWQILLTLLGMATIDGAKILAKLEEILSKLGQLKTSLDNLSGLPDVADTIRTFRGDPNRRALAALASASATATPSMRQLHDDLGEVLDPLTDVAGNLSDLVRGLRVAADAGIPVVSDAARYAAERIGLIEEPLLGLQDGLGQLYQNISADIRVLENIQEAVRQAREHEE